MGATTMAKDTVDLAEVKRFILRAFEEGKEEGYILEEVLNTFLGLTRPQAKQLIDSCVPGRTPENPIRFTFDPTPRRRCSPHLDRMPAIQQEDAALRAGGRPPRVQPPGPAAPGSSHMVFHKGKRSILIVKPHCKSKKKKFACITHGMIFATAAELDAHCHDTDEHDTTTTEFDAPQLGEGHVTAHWCEEVSRETTQHWMGGIDPHWVMHGLEALPTK